MDRSHRAVARPVGFGQADGRGHDAGGGVRAADASRDGRDPSRRQRSAGQPSCRPRMTLAAKASPAPVVLRTCSGAAGPSPAARSGRRGQPRRRATRHRIGRSARPPPSRPTLASTSSYSAGVISPSVASTNPSPTVAVDVCLAGWPWHPWRGSMRSWRFRPLGAARHPRQSTLALTAADRQDAAVARPTRMSAAPDEGRHRLLANDPHAARGDVQCATTGLA